MRGFFPFGFAQGQNDRTFWASLLGATTSLRERLMGRRCGGGARSPCGGLGDEPGEQRSGGGALFEGAFRMPLDAEHEIAAHAIGRSFDRLDDAILAAARGHAKAIAGGVDRLMMAGVDRKAKKSVALGKFLDRDHRSEERRVGKEGRSRW